MFQPHQNKPFDKAGLGCASIIGLLIFIGWIASLAGCDSTENKAHQQLLKELGPNNRVAQRIRSLSPANAYMVGLNDGANDAAKMAARLNWSEFDYPLKLEQFRELQSAFFDALATQNEFNPTVLQEYKRGWDTGASSLRVR